MIQSYLRMLCHFLLRSRWLYALALVGTFIYTLQTWQAQHNGDVDEYTATTMAIANHATPAIRLADLEDVQRLIPHMKGGFREITEDLQQSPCKVHLTYACGYGGKVYAIHYFAYSALAAIPFKLLPLAGMDPFKCYLALNLFFVLLLGLSLRRVLDDNLKAIAALTLFLTCGLWAYLRWTSPETVSAAGLLAALLLYCSGAPLRAGLLASVGAMQNPSIILVFGFLPLLRLAMYWPAQRNWRALLAAGIPDRRHFAGLLLGGVIGLTTPLWNLVNFGTLSIIGSAFTHPALFTLNRLHSLFLDLCQGMIIGIPALLVLLLAWSRGGQAQRLLLACAALMLAMALPALPVINWNSGAQGVMRYAVWGAMPLLAALVWQLSSRRGWLWLPPVVVMLALQVMVTQKLQNFRYVEFSPLALSVMTHAPRFYNPDPELFAERVKHADNYINLHESYTLWRHGQPLKSLYHPGVPESVRALCGEGMTPSASNSMKDVDEGWRYVNGAVKCEPLPATATGK